MAGISSKAAGKLENKYKFNEGTELTNDFDISLYETPHRSYDPQIGRFLQIDEFGEVLEEWSSYVFALNNPISFNDPEGLYPDDPLPKEVPKDAPAPTLPNVTVVALRKTGDVFHGFNRYYSILAKTDGDLSRIVNDQFRNEMYRYQELAQFRNRVNEMTRATDEVALEIGSNFIPMGWLVKIGKLRYLQKVYLLKRGKAITTVGKGTNLVDDGANVAVNAVENATKTGMGLADDFLASATKSWGDQGLTVAGRALQKHAGREGSVFQGIKFSHKTANQDGLNIINQIMGSKNQIIQQAENGGKLIFDNTTGRGFGVSREGLFNGFRELGK